MVERVDRKIWQRRLASKIFVVFALLVALLAVVGLYGLTSHLVLERQRSIGIRLALGASRESMRRAILGETLRLTAIGIALGAVGALGLGVATRSLLYDLPPTDPLSFVFTSLLLATTALAAGWFPASRAARIDPAQSLKA